MVASRAHFFPEQVLEDVCAEEEVFEENELIIFAFYGLPLEIFRIL